MYGISQIFSFFQQVIQKTNDNLAIPSDYPGNGKKRAGESIIGKRLILTRHIL